MKGTKSAFFYLEKRERGWEEAGETCRVVTIRLVQCAQLSPNYIVAASKNEWNYMYQGNDKVTIKCKRKNNKNSKVKEVFSYPRITHLISVCQKCGQIMSTNLYLGA